MRRHRFTGPMIVLAATASLAFAAAGVEELGFDHTQLEESLFGALRGWYGAPDVPAEVRALPDAEKVAAVKALGAFAKEFFASPDMQKRYDEVRKSSKPKHGIGLPKLKLDAKAIAQKAAARAGGQQPPPSELDKDPRKQLKHRLEAFLATTEGVDYDAKTTEANHKGQFVDEAFESKPDEWKMCYRAGRATGEAVRAFAKEWLAELH